MATTASEKRVSRSTARDSNSGSPAATSRSSPAPPVSHRHPPQYCIAEILPGRSAEPRLLHPYSHTRVGKLQEQVQSHRTRRSGVHLGQRPRRARSSSGSRTAEPAAL